MPWRPDATRATGILACSRPNSRTSAPGVTVEWPEMRRGAHAKRHVRVAISQHAPGASLSGWTRASRRALSLRLPGRVGFRWRALAARLCRAVARCTALLLLVLACLSGTFLLFPDLLMEGGSWHWNRLSLRVRGGRPASHVPTTVRAAGCKGCDGRKANGAGCYCGRLDRGALRGGDIGDGAYARLPMPM
jgi:hypothetical protein